MNTIELSPKVQYLLAKRAIDDRSLNRQVYGKLASRLAKRPLNPPLRILEAGAGVGTMVTRLLEWGLLRNAEITAIDQDAETIAAMPQYLGSWAEQWGYTLQPVGDGWGLKNFDRQVIIHPVYAGLAQAAGQAPDAPFDLLIAHGSLAGADLDSTLPPLLDSLVEGGLFYVTMHPSSPVVILPAHALDQSLPAGECSGQALLDWLIEKSTPLLAVGGSGRVISPLDGQYHADECAFIDAELECLSAGLNDGQAAGWLAARRADLHARRLSYIQHQIDVCGVKPQV